VFKGEDLKHTIYKLIDFGGVIKIHEKILTTTEVYAPIEYLINQKVSGYNYDRATELFVVWPIVVSFAILEGYPYTWVNHFTTPIRNLL